MPRTGRPAKPTQTLKLTGAFRADRHGDRSDVIAPPAPGLPDSPTWLSDKAAAYWNEIGTVLEGRGLMSPIYSTALAAFCDALADWIDLGKVLENDVTEPKWWALKAKAWDRVMKSCREFGLTPSAISSVKREKQNEKPKAKDRFFPTGPATKSA